MAPKRKRQRQEEWEYSSSVIPSRQDKDFALARRCVIKSLHQAGSNEVPHPILEAIYHGVRYSLMTIDLFLDIRSVLDGAVECYSHEEPTLSEEFTEIESGYYDLITERVEHMHELVVMISKKDPGAYETLCRQLSDELEQNKANDVKTTKFGILDWCLKSRKSPIKPALVATDPKAKRGLKHPHFGGLLLPLDLQARWKSDSVGVLADIQDGKIKQDLNNPPAFLYPFARKYDKKKSILDGLFRGEIVLRCLRAIMTGASTAWEDKPKGGKESKGSMAGRSVPEVSDYAYAVAMTLFGLSSAESFTANVVCDDIDLQALYRWTKTLLSAENRWAKETMDFIQAAVPYIRYNAKKGKKRRIQPPKVDPVAAANELLKSLEPDDDVEEAAAAEEGSSRQATAQGVEDEVEDEDDTRGPPATDDDTDEPKGPPDGDNDSDDDEEAETRSHRSQSLAHELFPEGDENSRTRAVGQQLPRTTPITTRHGRSQAAISTPGTPTAKTRSGSRKSL
ncbi:hypothetical protein BKA70DRAFT_1268588 [Coprinopsis sp. MPI-PUGE-AT-0042]|nr:hypothetical protein BKA70DRAFT_1314641 [Coprinopsis sp. MPI-PUGE-AT-0042]KAH6911823.1 hypothetical protein BKA70DRAFT_1268588 [Coprinopsis sp. MPI-PUGE-AT-0042]